MISHRIALYKFVVIIISLMMMVMSVPSNSQVPFPVPTLQKKKQDTSTKPTLVRYDSSTVQARHPKEERFKEFNGSEFEYDRAMAPETMSWFQKFTRWLQSRLRFFSGTNQDIVYWEVFTWLLIITAFVLLGYLLARSNGGGFLTMAKKHVVVSHEEIPEDIHEINFNDKILEAVKEGNYRRAVRFQFLRILKQLSDNALIDLTSSKTNRIYARELKATLHYNSFINLVVIFEYVWYGDFIISQNEYSSIEQQFQDFLKSLPKKQSIIVTSEVEA